MQDEFLMPVTFKGKEIQLPCKFNQYAYTHKLEVDIEGTKVFFERDEERNWRALLSQEDLQVNKDLNVDLLKAISETIEQILK